VVMESAVLLASCLVLLALPETFVAQRQTGGHWHDPSAHRVQFVTVEPAVRLEVLDWGGTGKPVVLLAGLGMTAHVFDGFAEKLAQFCHVYGITRRGYGASSHPSSGYNEQRLAEDDLAVFTTLKLDHPVVAGHSVAGNELSQLGMHYYERVSGLVYLDALNDAFDDYGDYDALWSKVTPKPPAKPSAADMKSFGAYRDWKLRVGGLAIPEAELRTEFVENPDGSVGGDKNPEWVGKAIMAGDHRHNYADIRVPVLALIAYPGPPKDGSGKFIWESHSTPADQRQVAEAIYGTYIGMAKSRIERIKAARGGARVIELWDASHVVFLSNPAEVLEGMGEFIKSLPAEATQ
jgi:non-heme chloroperoxidase